MRGFCVFSLGPGHQKWKQESSEQADGAGSEGDQRAGRPGFGEGNFKRADFMKVGLFLITDPQSNRGMCDLHERQTMEICMKMQIRRAIMSTRSSEFI